MPSDALTDDIRVFILAMVVGVVMGFACGGVMFALRVIRSPRRGL